MNAKWNINGSCNVSCYQSFRQIEETVWVYVFNFCRCYHSKQIFVNIPKLFLFNHSKLERYAVENIMMTSSNGNIFRVTGPLWGETIGHLWIPSQRPERGALIFSLTFAWTNGWANVPMRRWFETPLRLARLHCNVLVYHSPSVIHVLCLMRPKFTRKFLCIFFSAQCLVALLIWRVINGLYPHSLTIHPCSKVIGFCYLFIYSFCNFAGTIMMFFCINS